MQGKSIKEWAIDDRPREKLLKNGPKTLSLSELLAILIQNGSKEKSALELAKEILTICKNDLDSLGKMSIKDLQKVKGIGSAKAVIIEAALELGRRRESDFVKENPKLNNSKISASFIRSLLKDETVEMFLVIYLNNASKYLNHEVISIGGITGTVVDTRIIMKRTLEENATKIIIAHNHPSGNLSPSQADKNLTEKIKQACVLMEINLVDHIIVSHSGYFTFSDEGFL